VTVLLKEVIRRGLYALLAVFAFVNLCQLFRHILCNDNLYSPKTQKPVA